MIGGQLLIVQDLYLQVGGEDVLQRGLDMAHEPGLDGGFLKELLQWSTKAESSMVTTSTSSNQVLMVVSDSWDLSRSSTFSTRLRLNSMKAPLSRWSCDFLSLFQAKIHLLLYQTAPEKSTHILILSIKIFPGCYTETGKYALFCGRYNRISCPKPAPGGRMRLFRGKCHLSRVNAQKSKNNFQEARMRAISSRKSCSEHR